ncbi:MAG: hypothetical protein IKA85_06075 [Clostridia bacterium]|nr:hypothetical protein [Clostridia bacterium]
MKKVLTILLTITLCFSAFSFVGCGEKALYNCITCKKEVFEAPQKAQMRKMCEKCYKKSVAFIPPDTQ